MEEEKGEVHVYNTSILSHSYLSSDILTNSLIPSCSEGGRAGVLFSSASSRPGKG